MNYLYLIGNGFDLAHGLPTSYNDFLFHYLNKIHRLARQNNNYHDDDLVKIENFKWLGYEKRFTSIDAILKFHKELSYSFNEKHTFFKSILKNYSNKRWVDIEYEYYLELLKLYFILEKSNERKHAKITEELIKLNKCFAAIKKELISYLDTIDYKKVGPIHSISNYTSDDDDVTANRMILNFNYTSTISKYVNHDINNIILNIHGRLNSPEKEQIFGYGDEMDSYYHKIVALNDNEFLKNFKSFGYLRNSQYQKIQSFIEDGPFEVRIMGHSCGISDRVLLSEIFQAKTCETIRIYYYQKSESENDYFEKSIEISRHFEPSLTASAKKKIIPEAVSFPLVPLK